MGIFFVLLLVPMVIQHIVVKGHRIDYEKRNKLGLAFFFLLLTVMVMLRNESVGTDTENYIYYFQHFSGMSWSSLRNGALEFGFMAFNKLVSLLSKEPQFFLGVAAVAVSALIYPTYRRLCVDASLTIALFCTMSTFAMMFTGIRQMLAIALGFVCYECTRRHKLLPFLLTVALALTFHTSAFMLVFMYPLYHLRITKKWLLMIVPAMAVVFVFNSQIFSVLSLVLARYTKYEGGISSTGAYTMLFLFAAFAAFAFIIPNESLLDEETIGLRNFLLFALVLQMFAPLHTLAMRMNYYYIIFIPLLMPRIIACKRKRWAQVAVLGRNIMVVFFLLYFFVNAENGGNLNVFPYHFFWE